MIVVDTGVLYAAADVDDNDHAACRDLINGHPGPLVVPLPVIGETSYMIGKRLGAAAEARFVAACGRGEVTVDHLVTADLMRMAELVDTYANLPLGTIDASVVAVAERLGTSEIATLDHRDFSVVRPVHSAAFTLLP